MRKALILCDNFSMGGIQRLALDQAFKLSEVGINTTVLILGPKPKFGTPSFFHTEKRMIKTLSVNFLFFEGSRKSQLNQLYQNLSKNNYELLICHSLRAVVLARVCKVFLKSVPVIVTIIHQLLSMSSPAQRIKRLVYSQFADILFAYSLAVKKDWDYRRKHNPFIRLITIKKKIQLCRNGVYLPRLKLNTSIHLDSSSKNKRFVFVSRLTAWKGLETVLELMSIPEYKNVKLLLVTPYNPTLFLRNIHSDIRKRIVSVSGKSVSRIRFRPGDVHIYPTKYGRNSKFVESISLNVLEMCCVGVRSLISENGSETWPELTKMGMIYEVDWKQKKQVVKALNMATVVSSKAKIRECRSLIDISHNLDNIFEACQITWEK